MADVHRCLRLRGRQDLHLGWRGLYLRGIPALLPVRSSFHYLFCGTVGQLLPYLERFDILEMQRGNQSVPSRHGCLRL